MADDEREHAWVIGAAGKSYPGRVIGTTTAEIIEPEVRPLTIFVGPVRSTADGS